MDAIKKLINSPQQKYLLPILLVFVGFIWEISNLDALRQGTEGFYLQISKEMFQQKSFLTPLYLDHPHWSKPPLHFWMPFPLYFLNGGPSIAFARITVLLLSISSLALFCHWILKRFKIPFPVSFLFFASSIGFLKYSRIFMMEMPLTLLTVLAVVYFYEYLEEKRRRDFVLSVIFLAMASLIKGPVAFVMAGLSLGSYQIYTYVTFKRIFIKPLFVLFSIATVLSSIWYIACYLKYGYYFIEYFFIRENLGKFSSQSYPLKSVIQGLLVYSFPWCLFIPLLYSNVWKTTLKKLHSPDSRGIIFLALNFLCFLILWMIPNQRSHHYAIPSLPFFLALLLIGVYRSYPYFEKGIVSKISKWILLVINCILISVLSLSLTIKDLPSDPQSILVTCLSIAFLIWQSVNLFKMKHQLVLTTFLSLTFLWVYTLPKFYLPTVPQEVVRSIQTNRKKEVAIVFRKPYFIEEAINKKVTPLDKRNIEQYIQNHKEFYIVHESLFNELKLGKLAQVIHSWPIWRRGRRPKEIFSAIKSGELSSLRENLLLLSNHP